MALSAATILAHTIRTITFPIVWQKDLIFLISKLKEPKGIRSRTSTSSERGTYSPGASGFFQFERQLGTTTVGAPCGCVEVRARGRRVCSDDVIQPCWFCIPKRVECMTIQKRFMKILIVSGWVKGARPSHVTK